MKNNLLKCFIISVAFSISYFNIICASDRLSSTTPPHEQKDKDETRTAIIKVQPPEERAIKTLDEVKEVVNQWKTIGFMATSMLEHLLCTSTIQLTEKRVLFFLGSMNYLRNRLTLEIINLERIKTEIENQELTELLASAISMCHSINAANKEFLYIINEPDYETGKRILEMVLNFRMFALLCEICPPDPLINIKYMEDSKLFRKWCKKRTTATLQQQVTTKR